jgi:very-short-patch-repair endonuclease
MARRLARKQHWTIARRQLEDLGFSDEAIKHRIRTGRLREVHRGVYAVDREDLTPGGHGMAAVLACGDEALLSHESAAVLWGILPRWTGYIQVTVPVARNPRRPGIKVHRRSRIGGTRRNRIPVTTAVDTLVDLATRHGDEELERAVNEAVNRGLTDPESLRTKVAAMRRRPGARRLLKLLDRDTYVVTDTWLEQRFLRIARKAGLPKPQTQRQLEGGRVDFYWPELGLIVEADSLRYHRTPLQQAADRRRDQLHAAAGRSSLRFTHQQIFFEEPHAITILATVARRLAR